MFELYCDFIEDCIICVDDFCVINGIYCWCVDGLCIIVVELGVFNFCNCYNINSGIVYFFYCVNLLSVEVNLVGVLVIMCFKGDGMMFVFGVGDEELLCCCEGGNFNCNSDLLIF